MLPGELADRLTEADFMMLSAYAQKRMLPTRRLQLTIARVAQAHAGGKLADFLFDPVEAKPTPTDAGDALAAAGGVGVKRRKKKRG